MSIETEVVEEFGKVKDVLRTMVSKLNLASETEVAMLLQDVEAIVEPEPAEETAPETAAPAPATAPASQTASSSDPLAGYSVEDLQAELAARQTGSA